MTKRDGDLRRIFRAHLKEAQWSSIETGATAGGVPDSDYCFEGRQAGWIEFKNVNKGWRVVLQPAQVAWISRRICLGGTAWIAAGKEDTLFMVHGRTCMTCTTTDCAAPAGPGHTSAGRDAGASDRAYAAWVIKQGAVMTKRKPPDQIQKNGRKSTFLTQYVNVARRMAYMGATDRDLAAAFGTTIKCIWDWKAKHPAFGDALVVGKNEADQRMIRSVYQRGVGYDYDAVKIFMPAGAKSPIYAPYVEHVPPDPAAGMFWLKNRQPDKWRDVHQLEHVTGKYVISDRPLSAEEWIKARAVVVDGDDAVDVTPQLEDQSVTPAAPEGNGKTKK